MKGFLKKPSYRLIFAEEEGITPVSHLVSHKISKDALQIQLVYEALYCIWLLSFSDRAKDLPQMCDPALVFSLINLLRTVENDKIVRMSLGVLKVRVFHYFAYFLVESALC